MIDEIYAAVFRNDNAPSFRWRNERPKSSDSRTVLIKTVFESIYNHDKFYGFTIDQWKTIGEEARDAIITGEDKNKEIYFFDDQTKLIRVNCVGNEKYSLSLDCWEEIAAIVAECDNRIIKTIQF